MEQLDSYLPAADVTLSDRDPRPHRPARAPGVTVNPDDNSYGDHEPNRRHDAADDEGPAA